MRFVLVSGLMLVGGFTGPSGALAQGLDAKPPFSIGFECRGKAQGRETEIRYTVEQYSELSVLDFTIRSCPPGVKLGTAGVGVCLEATGQFAAKDRARQAVSGGADFDFNEPERQDDPDADFSYALAYVPDPSGKRQAGSFVFQADLGTSGLVPYHAVVVGGRVWTEPGALKMVVTIAGYSEVQKIRYRRFAFQSSEEDSLASFQREFSAELSETYSEDEKTLDLRNVNLSCTRLRK